MFGALHRNVNSYNGLHRINNVVNWQLGRWYATVVVNKVKNYANGSHDKDSARPYADIPMVKGLPVVGTLFEWGLNIAKIHEIPIKRVKQYGPIYREKIGFAKDADNVFTANLDDWEEICRGESRGNPSIRSYVWSLDAYTNKRKLPGSIVGLQGDDYTRVKSAVKSLLKPVDVAKLVPKLAEVTDDLTLFLDSKTNEDGVVEDLREHIQRWTLECGGTIVYRARLGMLNLQGEEEKSTDLLNAIKDWFKYFALLECGLPHHKLLLSKLWRRFEKANDTLRSVNKQIILEFEEHVTDKAVQLSDIEREEMALAVLSASVDTTSHTALWTLITLSQNPHIQDKIYQEVSKAYRDGKLIQNVIQLPYLRGFLKEVFRIQPIVPILRRVLTEDLVLSGYHVPAGSTVNFALSAYNGNHWYSDAEVIKPERWMRMGKKDNDAPSSTPGSCPVKHHSFGVLPFGHGHRACLGRRVAESELCLLISKMVYKYRIHPVKEYNPTFSLFITPEGSVDMKLEKRC